MSLINEALKKAQRMRAEIPASPAPAADGTPAPVVVRRSRPIPAQTLVLAAIGGAVLVTASIVTTLIFLRPDAPAPVAKPPAPTPVASAPAGSVEPPSISISLPPVGPSLPTTAGIPPTVSTTPPATAPTVPLAQPEGPKDTPVANQPVVTDATEATATIPTPVTASEGPPKPNPRVQEFIDNLRVSGIRASSTDPRVSMNDRVFKLNDVVDRTLGLRVIAIESSGLTFMDAAGVTYLKNF